MIISDSNTLYTSTDNSNEIKAIECQVDPGWTAQIAGAKWIWDTYSLSTSKLWKTLVFKNRFAIPGIPSAATLRIASDNNSSVTINGNDAGCSGASFGKGYEKDCNILPYLNFGMNIALFTVTNQGGSGGLLYLIDISANVS